MTAPSVPGPSHILRLHDHTELDTPHLVGFLWTSDQPNAEISTWQHTTFTRDGHAFPLQDLKSHPQQVSGQHFYNAEYHFIPHRELVVKRMIPDDDLPLGEDSEPCWSFGIHLLLLWLRCLRFLIAWSSTQTTWGTESAFAAERPQLKNFQYMFTTLLCRQDPIQLFTQLCTDTTYAVPN